MIFNAHEPQSDANTEPTEYGTSPLMPADDPTAWPLLRDREATPVEIEALGAKLTHLKRAAEMFGQTLGCTEDENLIVATEDDPPCFTRLLLPARLPEQLELTLITAERLLGSGEYTAAMAYLRLAEVLLRLANGWGHAEVQAQVDGFMGLAKGERATALILTTAVSRSRDYGDIAEHSVTIVNE